MKSQTQHIDPLLDNWKTNWETSYLSATTDTPNKLRVAGESPKTNRLFIVTPGLEYELTYTQSENNSVSFSIEESDNGTSWQNVVSNASSNGTQTVSFTPNASFLRVSFESTNSFQLHEISLNGELFDTLIVMKAFGGTGYRYGFNSMERDDEVKGQGNSYDFGARMYDSRLGRWLSIDPLAVKYPDLSPYNFVANSPLLYVDPDGREIIVGIGHDSNGKVIIDISISGAIINESKKDISDRQMDKYLKKLNDEVKSVYGKKFDDFDVNISLNFRIAKTREEINVSDHVISIQDEESFRVKNIARVNRIGGMVMFVPVSGMNSYKSRTRPHEIGHWLGLLHPWDNGYAELFKAGINNIMAYDKADRSAFFNQLTIEDHQIKQITQLFFQRKLNQGGNWGDNPNIEIIYDKTIYKYNPSNIELNNGLKGDLNDPQNSNDKKDTNNESKSTPRPRY